MSDHDWPDPASDSPGEMRWREHEHERGRGEASTDSLREIIDALAGPPVPLDYQIKLFADSVEQQFPGQYPGWIAMWREWQEQATSPPPMAAPSGLREALTDFVVWWDNDYDPATAQAWLYDFAVRAARLVAPQPPMHADDIERVNRELRHPPATGGLEKE